MNRIVLIGNGFNIAHSLRTSYADFIHWYWTQIGYCLLRAESNKVSDELCSFTLIPSQYYSIWFQFWQQSNLPKNNPHLPRFGDEAVEQIKDHKEYCDFQYKSDFFKRINESIETKGWVDIENEYYMSLKDNMGIAGRYERATMEKLNGQLTFLRNKLIEYLKKETQKDVKLFDEIKDNIYRPIAPPELAISAVYHLETLTPECILLLNFNYTNTPERYLQGDAEINYIHGQLDNPDGVIFGYGDEMDEDYNKLQNLNDNEYLKNIKSIRYLESDNYRKVLQLIESDQFQVCIMGHSCGNSDRTLLNTLFEHPNCVSIKPYYYINKEGKDNYLDLVMNIRRNFNDPAKYRDRVVKKPFCEPLTGEKPGVIVME